MTKETKTKKQRRKRKKIQHLRRKKENDISFNYLSIDASLSNI